MFTDITFELGVPLADNKTVGPTSVFKFLGFVIDTELMMLKIPEDNIYKLVTLLSPFLYKKKLKIKHLESVTRLITFCSRAIPSSRAFIRRFYVFLTSVKVKKPYYSVRINLETKADAELWLEFLQNFNGVCYFPEAEWLSNDILQLFTDSAGKEKFGCAAYADGHWAQFP